MNLFRFLVVSLSLCVFGNFAVRADDWPVPEPRMFASPDGATAFRVTPEYNARGTLGSPVATGWLFRLDRTKDRTIWETKLVNVPYRVHVTNDDVLVTLGTWGTRAGNNDLVLYDKDGKVVAKHAATDFLTEYEKKTFIENQFNWLDNLSFHPVVKGILDIRFHFGKTVHLDVTTGKLK